MVFDSHSDIWSDVTVKFMRGETDIFRRYHYERLREGGIEGSILAMWIDPPYDKTPALRLEQIMEAIEAETVCCQDLLRIVHDYGEMTAAREEGLFYAFIGCEGLSGIGEDIEKIDMLYEFGVRHASLTWNERNALAAGARAETDRGLTELGIRARSTPCSLPSTGFSISSAGRICGSKPCAYSAGSSAAGTES